MISLYFIKISDISEIFNRKKVFALFLHIMDLLNLEYLYLTIDMFCEVF